MIVTVAVAYPQQGPVGMRPEKAGFVLGLDGLQIQQDMVADGFVNRQQLLEVLAGHRLQRFRCNVGAGWRADIGAGAGPRVSWLRTWASDCW